MHPGGPLVFLVRKLSQHCFARAVAETVQPRSVRCRWRTGWVGGRLLQRSALPADMFACCAFMQGEFGSSCPAMHRPAVGPGEGVGPGLRWQRDVPTISKSRGPALSEVSFPSQRGRADLLSASCCFKNPQLEIREYYSSPFKDIPFHV